MPGHGRALADSHKDLPVVDASEEELENRPRPVPRARRHPCGDDRAYRYTAWDDENPGTLSPVVVGEVIRGKIGFSGLLLTDDLDMEALTGTVPERARRAVAAGCDIALNCWAKMDDMVGIAGLLPAMSEVTAAPARPRADPPPMTAPRRATSRPLLAKRDELLALAGRSGMNEGTLIDPLPLADNDEWDAPLAAAEGESALYLELDGWGRPARPAARSRAGGRKSISRASRSSPSSTSTSPLSSAPRRCGSSWPPIIW